jgi:hypothetical protein
MRAGTKLTAVPASRPLHRVVADAAGQQAPARDAGIPPPMERSTSFLAGEMVRIRSPLFLLPPSIAAASTRALLPVAYASPPAILSS